MCGKRGQQFLSTLREGFKSMATESIDDIKTLAFWRAVLVEFFGLMFVVLVGCGSWIQGDSQELLTMRVSLAFGLIYAVMLFCVWQISGGHLNPAVSITVMIIRKVSVVRGFIYVVAQCLGAVVGAAMLLAITPEAYRANLGATIPATAMTDGMAFGTEFLATFLLVFVILLVYGKTPKDDEIPNTPFIIGLTVVVLSLFSVPYTGGSFNPARSFGPAAVQGVWTSHWLYWFGPIIGGLAGGLTYEALFAPKASIGRVRSCLTRFRMSTRSQLNRKNTDVTVEATEPERVALKSNTLASTESLHDMDEDEDVIALEKKKAQDMNV